MNVQGPEPALRGTRSDIQCKVLQISPHDALTLPMNLKGLLEGPPRTTDCGKYHTRRNSHVTGPSGPSSSSSRWESFRDTGSSRSPTQSAFFRSRLTNREPRKFLLGFAERKPTNVQSVIHPLWRSALERRALQRPCSPVRRPASGSTTRAQSSDGRLRSKNKLRHSRLPKPERESSTHSFAQTFGCQTFVFSPEEY
jgi:hypothetical protein